MIRQRALLFGDGCCVYVPSRKVKRARKRKTSPVYQTNETRVSVSSESKRGAASPRLYRTRKESSNKPRDSNHMAVA